GHQVGFPRLFRPAEASEHMGTGLAVPVGVAGQQEYAGMLTPQLQIIRPQPYGFGMVGRRLLPLTQAAVEEAPLRPEPGVVPLPLDGFGVVGEGLLPLAQLKAGTTPAAAIPGKRRRRVDQTAQVEVGREPVSGLLALLGLLLMPGAHLLRHQAGPRRPR